VLLTAREGAVSAAGGEIESFAGTAPRRFIEQKLGRKPRLLSSRSLASGEPKPGSCLTDCLAMTQDQKGVSCCISPGNPL
jgi:hypothetical protein